MVEHQPVIHVKFRMSPYQLSLELHLYHKDGLMHHHIHVHVVTVVFLTGPNHKGSTVAVLIGLHGKAHKRYQIDAVALFYRAEIGISDGQTYHSRDRCRMPRRGSHPDDVMIAPFNVHGMVLQKSVHDDMSAGTPVVDIPDYVEMIDHEPLYEV